MPVSWNHEKELKLLTVIIQAANVKPAWGDIASAMNAAYGGGFTADGLRQHYHKNILKTANNVGSSNTPAVGPSAPTAVVTTTHKRKADTTSSDEDETPAPKKKKELPKIAVKDEAKDPGDVSDALDILARGPSP